MTARLCLNMIVRNETANLARCLGAVAPHIACWVIGDTGSTDGTQDFIADFFQARGIPGELHFFPFANFEQARNDALSRAAASPLAYDYLLLADADMELVVAEPAFRDGLDAAGYDLVQRSGISYWNTRLLRRGVAARYRGVTHEYLDVPGGAKKLHGASFIDHATGANRPGKFERDIRLLTEALKDEPENQRSWFYLAQSYRDAGRNQEAADAYAKRAAMGGWDEEAWYARLARARCLRDLKDEAGFVAEALAAFNQRPHRAEPLYDSARHYRERGQNEASTLFAEAGLALPRPADDALFVEDFVYAAGLREEYSIAAFYTRDSARRNRGFAVCDRLALDSEVPPAQRILARQNLRFYVARASMMMPSFVTRPVRFTPPETWHPALSSLTRDGDQVTLVHRAVNPATSETRHFQQRLATRLDAEAPAETVPATLPAACGRVLDENGKPFPVTAPTIVTETFRRGTQAVEFDGGQLSLIHELSGDLSDAERSHQHRFAWVDATGILRRVSRPFFLERKGVEIAAGLAWHPDGRHLIASFTVAARESWIATVDAGDVRAALGDTAGNFERPTEAFGLSQVQKPAWVPEAAAAGTELMRDGLRARLGQGLDRIDLRINHPGDDAGNGRPRVVWIHHDANQRYMQWCTDTARVASVACFVFVSEWQRDRYSKAFALPPERCVVLRNATDVVLPPRQWEAGPIWRCAYTSTPFRGLSVLLDGWRRLNPANAELHIWSSMKLYLMDDGPYADLYEQARSIPGVVYHGLAPNSELRAALRDMDFFVYPCTFAETSCLAAIEAMAAGCRVIVPSLGALPETTQGFARVYPWTPDENAHAGAFAEVLGDEMANPWGGRPEQSMAQQRHCAAIYDWNARLEEWRRLIDEIAERRKLGAEFAAPRHAQS